MDLYEMIFCGIVCFLTGRLFESFKNEGVLSRQKAAYLRTIKCFYKIKSTEETMESIIHDAIALGADLRYISDSYDLYNKWLYFRNNNVPFATDRYPEWQGDQKSNKNKSLKLSDNTIYTPEYFKPSNVNLDKYNHLKSNDLFGMKL
jgi:hypothetical protein